MTRALAATGIAVVLALSGCKPAPPAAQKSGPADAQGNGVVVTVAEKARVPFVTTVPLPGRIATDSTFSGPTVTAPSTAFVGSAALVATTWKVPAVVGAV